MTISDAVAPKTDYCKCPFCESHRRAAALKYAASSILDAVTDWENFEEVRLDSDFDRDMSLSYLRDELKKLANGRRWVSRKTLQNLLRVSEPTQKRVSCSESSK